MDFGCGTGISIPLLLEVLKAEQVIGLDPSRRFPGNRARDCCKRQRSFTHARGLCASPRAGPRFLQRSFPSYSGGRSRKVLAIYLRSDLSWRVFALWENNPCNPIVLYSMKTAELDFNAIPITAPRA